MKFDIIGSDIQASFPGCGFSAAAPKSDILAAKIGFPDMTAEDGCIYLINDIPHGVSAVGNEPANIICLAEHGSHIMGCNIILVASQDLMIPVFNHIQDMLVKENEVSSLARYALTSNVTIQDIVNRITAVLGNPVVVADLGHKILAMSDVDLDDSAWSRFRSLGCLPYNHETVDQLNSFFEGIKNGRKVIMEDGLHKKNYSIRATLTSGKTVIGQIVAHSHFREFVKADVDTMETLSGIVSLALVQRSFVRPDMYTVSDYMISDLVRGTLKNEEDIQNWLQFMNWRLKKYLYLIIVRWDGEAKSVDVLDACATDFRRILPEGLGTIIDGDLVMFFSLNHEIDEGSGLLELLDERLCQAEARAILSSRFSALGEMSSQYVKAKTVLDINLLIGRPERLHRAEAGMLELMFHIVGKEYDLMEFCHPLIRKLQEYDTQNNTDFIKYLRAYIFSGRNFSRAAAKLYTHRNTVIYRIKRIGELMDIDLQEEEMLFHFEFSLYLLNYIEFISGAKKPGEFV